MPGAASNLRFALGRIRRTRRRRECHTVVRLTVDVRSRTTEEPRAACAAMRPRRLCAGSAFEVDEVFDRLSMTANPGAVVDPVDVAPVTVRAVHRAECVDHRGVEADAFSLAFTAAH